jgi:hypothetical protein
MGSNTSVVHFRKRFLVARSSVGANIRELRNAREQALNSVKIEQASGNSDKAIEKLWQLVMYSLALEVAQDTLQKLEILNVNHLSLFEKHALANDVQNALDFLGVLAKLHGQDSVAAMLKTFAKWQRPRTHVTTREMQIYASGKNVALLNPEDVINYIKKEMRGLELDINWLDVAFSKNATYADLWKVVRPVERFASVGPIIPSPSPDPTPEPIVPSPRLPPSPPVVYPPYSLDPKFYQSVDPSKSKEDET